MLLANDNSIGQIVISGKLSSIKKFGEELKIKKIKLLNCLLVPLSHCPLMRKATEEMKIKILNTKFKNPFSSIISMLLPNPKITLSK